MLDLSSAYDKSSYYVTLDFYDEEGAPVAPVSAAWTLTNGNGAIVNSRDNVAIASPIGTTTTVSLSGADLASGSNRAANTRIVTVKATYISTVTGAAMPLNKAARFTINALPGV